MPEVSDALRHQSPSMPGAFYLSVTCETCGEDMYEGLVLTTLTHNGYPLLALDLAVSQITFTCDHCGSVTYTGDFEEMCQHEAGEESDDEDED